MRLNFDPPESCEFQQVTTAFPNNLACDFGVGGVHKVFSPSTAAIYPDVAFLVNAFSIRAAEILAMQEQLLLDPMATVDVSTQALQHSSGPAACLVRLPAHAPYARCPAVCMRSLLQLTLHAPAADSFTARARRVGRASRAIGSRPIR